MCLFVCSYPEAWLHPTDDPYQTDPLREWHNQRLPVQDDPDAGAACDGGGLLDRFRRSIAELRAAASALSDGQPGDHAIRAADAEPDLPVGRV